MDISLLIVVVLLATVALRLALVLTVVWLLVPRRPQCPQCTGSTWPLVTVRPLQWLWLERRWCLECGWEGISKRVMAAAQAGAPTQDGQSGDGDRWKARWDDDDQWSPIEGEGWR